MALAVAQVIGNATGTGGGGTITVTFGSSTTTGSLIALIGPCYNTSGAAAGSDFTDNKGPNTYTLAESNLGGASALGFEAAYNNAGTRGASHQVSFNGPGTTDTSEVAGVEITGQDSSTPFDTTTHTTAADGTSPFAITAAAAISGNQIAIYGVVIDTSGTNAWSGPAGYTLIGQLTNGAADLIYWTGYKINETGTPTVSATNTDVIAGAGGKEIFFTFKEAAASGFDVPDLHPPFPIVNQAVYRM